MSRLRDEIADIIGNACCEFMDRDGEVTLGPYADAVLALLREEGINLVYDCVDNTWRDPVGMGFERDGWLLDLGETS